MHFTKYFKILITPPVYFGTLKMQFPQCVLYENSRGVLPPPTLKTPIAPKLVITIKGANILIEDIV